MKSEEEAAVRCPNVECPAQIFRSIVHFASKSAMNIDGLGPQIVHTLLDNKLITSVADLYALSENKLLQLDNFKEKSVNNLLSAIEKSKSNSLDRLVFGLGIRNIGQASAKLLCDKFGDLDNIMNASSEQISEIDGFGGVMAQSVYNAFHEEHMIELIQRLKECGINTKYEKIQIDDRFAGKTFVLTGTLPTLKRSEAKALIEKTSILWTPFSATVDSLRNTAARQAAQCPKKRTMFLQVRKQEASLIKLSSSVSK